MRCEVCGAELAAITTDLPFKVRELGIVILKGLPVLQGFLEPLSRKMSYQIRAWISYLIESKWLGRELTIKSDEQLKAILEVEETRYRETDIFESHYKYR